MREAPQGSGSPQRHAALLERFLLSALIPLALLSLSRGLQNAVNETGPGRSTDLYPYWLGGYRLTLHQDPYREAIQAEGAGAERAIAGVSAQRPITNLPPMLLVLSPLSFLPWHDAKLVSALVNTTLALVIPWIPLRWLPERLSRVDRITFALAFYALLPTRNAIANGQTSLLVVACSLVAVDIVRRNQVLAGVLLALALSKFSIALPLLLWFVLYRWQRTIIVALTVQGVGLLLLSQLSRAAPWTLLESYGRGLAVTPESYAPRADQFGTSSLFAHLHLPPAWGYVAAAVLLLAAVASLFSWRRPRGIRSFAQITPHGDPVGPVLASGLLLVLPIPLLFHGAYDALGIVMLPAALRSAHSVVKADGTLAQTSFRRATYVAIAAGGAFLLPGTGVFGASATWQFLHPTLLSVASLCIVGVLIWLCRQYPQWSTRAHAAGRAPGPLSPLGRSSTSSERAGLN